MKDLEDLKGGVERVLEKGLVLLDVPFLRILTK
jgi:hypothetical protein